MNALADLVGDVDRFGREVWGARPFRMGEPGPPAAAPLTLADVDRIITSSMRVPAIRLVRAGERIATRRFCSAVRIGSTTLHDVADAHKVLDEFRRGATIVLQSLHRTWAPMSQWCADLEVEIGWPVQCNAYLSPADTSGLRRHADGHDVFVVQTHGSKRWDVEGMGELVLHVGEVLYLPAGVEHDASTGDEPSLHVTVGMHRPEPMRLVRAALDRVDLAAPPVPLGAAVSLSSTLSTALHRTRVALAEVDPDDIERAVRRPPRRHPGGLIERAVGRGAIHDDSTMSLVADAGLGVEVAGDRLRCTWRGGTLVMPSHVAPAMRAIADFDGAEPLPVGDLPHLDPEARVVLARRLADEGLITVTHR